MAIQDVQPRESHNDPIALGDVAAASGDWSAAIAAWESALQGEDAAGAQARIQWFLQRQETSTSRPTSQAQRLRLMLGSGCALLGTALVFQAQSVSGQWSSVLSVAVWLLYGAVAVFALMYARHSGPAQTDAALQQSDVQAARTQAESLHAVDAPSVANVGR